MGGIDRLRISSQSLKRAWRTSDLFKSAMHENLGVRTKTYGLEIYKKLCEAGIKDKDAREWAKLIAGVFGKLKGEDKKNPDNLCDIEIEQLAHIAPEERSAVESLLKRLIEAKTAPKAEDLKLLRKPETAVDIALFGRMLASSPENNVEAACQVSHAISVHPVVIEDDYFTAVDDLNNGEGDSGAAHIGETGFASALFYTYICIDKDLLVKNLGANKDLAGKAILALLETAVKVAPEGKQNSYASRAWASYVLAEKGYDQPRSLSVAFLKPVCGNDYGRESVDALQTMLKNIDKVYDLKDQKRYELDVLTGVGSFSALKSFVSQEDA
jgi:CRISPR system Cascade subunit CasC